MVCPHWSYVQHRNVSSHDVAYGTVTAVSCDDGFMFPDHYATKMVECVTTQIGLYTNATWNDTQLTCHSKRYKYVHLK